MAGSLSLRERILAAAMVACIALLLVFLWFFPTVSTNIPKDKADLI